MKPKRLFIVSQIFKLIPASRCHNLKAKLLRWCGAHIGENVEIMSSVKIYGNMSLYIGNNCFIGHEALIFGAAGSKITIEDYAKLGSRSIIVTGTHRFSPDGNCIEKEGEHKDVRICRGAAVSTGSTILPGITVGEMAHVAAQSVVTKDVEPYIRVAGNPARPIRNLKTNERIG
ncbi:MAG: DapH/DapD/GlmU-related protein [Alistipes sp.]|jgi:acetyltransferase-like isoleucine patch superfamily enzyme|nr:DapH/DapD/GlmU-related protein [Alistipes sp.]